MDYSVKVTIDSVAGTCDAGMKPGDSFIVRNKGCMVLEGTDGFCPEVLYATFPTCMTFAAGGSVRWEENGGATVACPDPEARVVAKVERIKE